MELSKNSLTKSDTELNTKNLRINGRKKYVNRSKKI